MIRFWDHEPQMIQGSTWRGGGGRPPTVVGTPKKKPKQARIPSPIDILFVHHLLPPPLISPQIPGGPIAHAAHGLLGIRGTTPVTLCTPTALPPPPPPKSPRSTAAGERGPGRAHGTIGGRCVGPGGWPPPQTHPPPTPTPPTLSARTIPQRDPPPRQRDRGFEATFGDSNGCGEGGGGDTQGDLVEGGGGTFGRGTLCDPPPPPRATGRRPLERHTTSEGSGSEGRCKVACAMNRPITARPHCICAPGARAGIPHGIKRVWVRVTKPLELLCVCGGRGGGVIVTVQQCHPLSRWRRLAVGGGWRRLSVGGGWRLVAVGGWWRLAAVVRWWRLAVGGGWQRLSVGGGWRLVVSGSCPSGLSLTKKKSGSFRTAAAGPAPIWGHISHEVAPPYLGGRGGG